MVSNKELYRRFILENHNIQIFSKDWWLDSVCGNENWDVCMVKQNDEILATMPYYISSKSPFVIIEMPPLTQNLGIQINYPDMQKLSSKYSFERKVLEDLILMLPTFDWLRQSFNHSLQNWLPFYWNNFKQTTAYTYILDTNTNLENLFEGFKSNIRREIRKAEKSLLIEESDDVELLYKMNSSSYKMNNIDIRYDFSTLKKLYNACIEKNACRLLIAKDMNTADIHSAHLYVWDSNSMYYLIGGSDSEFKSSGASSLLMWEGIKLAHQMKLKFDFEGSMNKSIERFFSSFGAEQVPYLRLEKINSKIIKLKRAIFN